MKLLGRAGLYELRGKNDLTDRWLTTWAAEICTSHWKQASDLTNQFPRAKEISHGCFAFPIAESEFEVNVMVSFTQGIAVVIGPEIE